MKKIIMLFSILPFLAYGQEKVKITKQHTELVNKLKKAENMAAVNEVIQLYQNEMPVYSLGFIEAKDGQFEIMNKSPNELSVTVLNSGMVYKKNQKVPASKGGSKPYLQSKLIPTFPTLLIVKYKSGGKEYAQAYVFPANKKVYLTWDRKNFARPQTGPLMGLSGKTESGLSLKGNVKKGNIKKLISIAK